MRPKLTAKHPRPATPSRAPVRSGTLTGRKPVRTEAADAKPAGKSAAKPAAPRASQKPAASPRGRGASGQPSVRPAKPAGSGDRFGMRSTADGSTRPARAPARPSAPGTARPKPEGRPGGVA